MTEKLKCWPGCRAIMTAGPNQGVIFHVVDRSYGADILFGAPAWNVFSLSGPAMVLAGPHKGRTYLTGVCRDKDLLPLPDLDDPVVVEHDEEVTS